jgi:hypothetical protein
MYRDYEEFLKYGDVDEEFLDELCTEKRYRPLADRGFIFYPSYRKTYLALKEHDADLAIRFLEALIEYGIVSSEPDPNDSLVRALLYAPMKTMDKAFCNYIEKLHKSKKEENNKPQETSPDKKKSKDWDYDLDY